MLKFLFLFGVLGVLLIPAECNLIAVCIEDDSDLRVDCLIKPKPNEITTYEFSLSSGTKEIPVNTNVSGSSADSQFRDSSQVVQLEPYGYRMTLRDYKPQHNTTYMCKVSGQPANISVEKEHLVQCSAVSLFLKSSCSWIVCLLFFYQTHS